MKQCWQQRNPGRGSTPRAEPVLPTAWDGAKSITGSAWEPSTDTAFGQLSKPLLPPPHQCGRDVHDFY